MVLDGRNAPTQVIDVVYPVNSVNPKLYKQGNTEPSVKACVETLHRASLKDEDKVRATKKFVELYGNEIASQQCVVTKPIVSTIVGLKMPPYQVTGKVHSPISVNPKLYKQGNTEPSMSQKLKACVETGRGISVKDKGTVRAYKKLYEPAGNSLASHNVRSNKTDHWVCPHGKALPSASVMGLVNCPNSVNSKSFRYENTEPSMNDKFKACVENIQAASVWKKICSELRGNLQNQPEMS